MKKIHVVCGNRAHFTDVLNGFLAQGWCMQGPMVVLDRNTLLLEHDSVMFSQMVYTYMSETPNT